MRVVRFAPMITADPFSTRTRAHLRRREGSTAFSFIVYRRFKRISREKRRFDRYTEIELALVLRYTSNDGYSFFNRIRASSVVNRQFTLALAALRRASQAATSRVNVSALSMRRSRH